MWFLALSQNKINNLICWCMLCNRVSGLVLWQVGYTVDHTCLYKRTIIYFPVTLEMKLALSNLGYATNWELLCKHETKILVPIRAWVLEDKDKSPRSKPNRRLIIIQLIIMRNLFGNNVILRSFITDSQYISSPQLQPIRVQDEVKVVKVYVVVRCPLTLEYSFSAKCYRNEFRSRRYYIVDAKFENIYKDLPFLNNCDEAFHLLQVNVSFSEQVDTKEQEHRSDSLRLFSRVFVIIIVRVSPGERLRSVWSPLSPLSCVVFCLSWGKLQMPVSKAWFISTAVILMLQFYFHCIKWPSHTLTLSH